MATTVLRLRKVKLWPYTNWRVVETFEALVWDPTAVHEAAMRTKRHPILAMLAKREGG